MAKEIKNENEAVVSAVNKVEQFLDNNKKTIWGVIAALVVIAGAGYVYYKFAYLPKKAEALAEMYKAEANFKAENYELALKGDGNVLGFEEIISKYGSKAGGSVYLYAAICELKAGNPDAAISYLGKYNGNDKIMSARAESLKGDAYCDKEEYDKAVSCFEKAAGIDDSAFGAAYLLKAGQAYEAIGNNEKALASYKKIKENYSQTMEAYDIDKYITRIEVK